MKTKGETVGVIKIPSRLDLVVEFLKATKWKSELRPKEIDVLALLIDKYLELKNSGLSDDIALIVLGDYKTKMDIKTKLDDMEDSSFQNLLSSLRKKGVMHGFRINPAFLPDITDKGEFKLTYLFKIDA